MSRVVIIAAPLATVEDYCRKQGLPLSVIEPLPSGDTRTVFNNSADAEKIRKGMSNKIVEGPVKRSPLYASRTSSPYR